MPFSFSNHRVDFELDLWDLTLRSPKIPGLIGITNLKESLRERVIPVFEAREDTSQLFCWCFFGNEMSGRSLGDSKIPKNFGTAFSKSLIFFDFTCPPRRKHPLIPSSLLMFVIESLEIRRNRIHKSILFY